MNRRFLARRAFPRLTIGAGLWLWVYVALAAAALLSGCSGPLPVRDASAAVDGPRAWLPMVGKGIAYKPATATPTASRTPAPAFTPGPGWRAALLDEAVGFAALAMDRTAFMNAPARLVTTSGNQGAGSLRQVLADSATGGGGWITFLPGVATIRTGNPLMVPPNTVIDGRAAAVRIEGGGLQIRRARNVIVHNVSISGIGFSIGRGCVDPGNDDAIKIIDESYAVWIDHATLACFDDGLIDITEASTDVTVSYTRMMDHAKGMLISKNPFSPEDANIRVTVYASMFDGVLYRHPKMRFGFVHLSNVFIGPWIGPAIDVCCGGRLLIEHSWLYGGPKSSHAVCLTCDETGSPGYAREIDLTLVPNGGAMRLDIGGAVAAAPYRLTTVSRDHVLSEAGVY